MWHQGIVLRRVTAVSPCVHPNCRDEQGNRRLVTANMCDSCQGQLHRDLDWIVEDFVSLKTFLPSPARRSQPSLHRHTAQVSFGHPAADASDACTEIAWGLNGIETALRTWVGDRPAPALVRTSKWCLARSSEPLLVNHAYRYLRGRFEQLCQWPDVGFHAAALHDTHQTNRAVYGLTRKVERLQLRCPDCDLAALVRDVGFVSATGEPPPARITCQNCGRRLDEDAYLSQCLMRIAWELREYEAQIAAAAEVDHGI